MDSVARFAASLDKGRTISANIFVTLMPAPYGILNQLRAPHMSYKMHTTALALFWEMLEHDWKHTGLVLLPWEIYICKLEKSNLC